MIVLEDFSIGFGNRVLLNDVNARFKPSRLTALIGRNGAGKSTLLKALAGINRRYEGKIIVNGNDIRSLQHSTLARYIAYVGTQRIRIANMTCRDVVAIGRAPYTDWMGRLSKTDNIIVDKALELTGMTEFATKTLDRMSDGECQRIMIARALAQDTPVILLDEPTSFLDMPNRYELVELLRRLATENNKTVIFSTHELDIATGMCHDIALIDNGRLYLLPAREMKTSGHIDRLFGTKTPFVES